MLPRMRMRFGPDDDGAFERAKDALLDEFADWLAADPRTETWAEEAPFGAAVALDWKHRYADGDLGRWDTSDVVELLVDWCPRKLSVPQEECHGLPGSLGLFLEFLEGSARLDRRSAPVDTLLAVIEKITPEYVEGMGDPSKFGMAKTLFASATGDGVDFGDPDAVDRWMAEFNARPEDERRRLLPAPSGTPTRERLPPVVVPDDAAVRASAAAAPILAMFRQFAGYVGAGRTLTPTGRLTLADARALVDLLGTGDRMDEQIGDRVFRTVTSDDLPRLRLVFAWARKAGVVRVARGRVVATKKAQALDRDPASLFEPAVRALLALGVLSAQRYDDRIGSWPDVTAFLDLLPQALLSAPYATQRPIPLDDLAAAATGTVLGAFEFPETVPESIVAQQVGVDVTDMIDALALAGVVTRHATTPPDRLGGRHLGGSVELTPAGIGVLRTLLVEAGYDAPVAGRYADRSATDLLLASDTYGFPDFWGELEAWRRRRSPDEATREVAAAISEIDYPLRVLAFAVLTELGVEVATPHVRRLAAEPATRGLATCWLVDHDLAPERALYDPADLASFVDALTHRLAAYGPDRLAATLALAGGDGDQVAVLGRLWRVDSPATAVVLEAIGAAHPAKHVAKAARKAAIQHHSWLAELRRVRAQPGVREAD